MIAEYFIGGGGDKDDFFAKIGGGSGIVGHLRHNRKIHNPDIETFYWGHEQEDDLFKEIKSKMEGNPEFVINITGHSWGGHASLNLANRLEKVKISINELITLDPVSMTAFLPIHNFSKWVNVYQIQTPLDLIAAIPVIGNLVGGVVSLATSWLPDHSLNDTIATTGGQLGDQTGAINIPCNVDHANAKAMYIMARTKMDSPEEPIK